MKRLRMFAMVAVLLGWTHTIAAQTAPAPSTMAVRITKARQATPPCCASTAGPAALKSSTKAR